MFQRNVIDEIVKTESYKNNALRSVKKVDFMQLGTNHFKPQKLYDFKDNHDYDLFTRLSFYNNGLISSVSNGASSTDTHIQNNKLHTQYIWGYNNSLLLAKIETTNLSFSSNVMSLINQAISLSNQDNSTCFDDIVNANCIENQINNIFNQIRDLDEMKNVLIENFTHNQGVGMTSNVKPNKQTTYYKYDEKKQLISAKDKDGKIIVENQYNYRPN